jgi:hypothetical protein
MVNGCDGGGDGGDGGACSAASRGCFQKLDLELERRVGLDPPLHGHSPGQPTIGGGPDQPARSANQPAKGGAGLHFAAPQLGQGQGRGRLVPTHRRKACLSVRVGRVGGDDSLFSLLHGHHTQVPATNRPPVHN